ncbi:MAG: SRPBCC family protein [Solirubrobacterales bacterium]
MFEIACEAEIQSPADRIFDLITDLRDQERWLPHSSSFRGTAELSENPVTLGTTYREREPMGVRNGTVTEFERPTKITFHQPMSMRAPLGTMDIVLSYTLDPRNGSTRVRRVSTISLPWQMKLARPLVVSIFRKEHARILQALKAHAENPS